MATVTKPVCRICRKQGQKLYLKGTRCESDSCPVDARHKKQGRPPRFRKVSEYGLQLKEKNKVKAYYGVLERQFRRYFDIAKKRRGVTGVLLLQMLECRMDNVVYRLGWVPSRRMARQMIVHGDIFLNGRRTDRPGHVLRLGDVVSVRPGSKLRERIRQFVQERGEGTLAPWLEMDREGPSAKLARFPERDEVSVPADEQLIVNLYSK